MIGTFHVDSDRQDSRRSLPELGDNGPTAGPTKDKTYGKGDRGAESLKITDLVQPLQSLPGKFWNRPQKVRCSYDVSEIEAAHENTRISPTSTSPARTSMEGATQTDEKAPVSSKAHPDSPRAQLGDRCFYTTENRSVAPTSNRTNVTTSSALVIEQPAKYPDIQGLSDGKYVS